MPEHQKTYEQGRIAGEIQALKDIAGDHKDRLDHHSNRLRLLERLMWAVLGIIALLRIWPSLPALLVGAAG